MAIYGGFQLAQLNVGRLRASIDSPEVAEFVDNLDRINALAEASPGFVWRLKDESNNATAIKTPFGEDVIVNMSTWETFEELRQFAFKTDHASFVRRRQEWFLDYGAAYLALWWVESGHRPSLAEAKARLDELARTGPGPHVFTFTQKFDPFGNPIGRGRANAIAAE